MYFNIIRKGTGALNSRERYIAAINHQKPDRVPVELRFSAALEKRLKQDLKLDDQRLWEWIGQDSFTVRPSYLYAVTPIKYADPTCRVENNIYYDIYQVPFKALDVGEGTYLEPMPVHPPLEDVETIQDLDNFPWPTTADWDYSGLPVLLDAKPNKTLWCRSRGCFQTATLMRGVEQLLVDMMLEEDLADAIFQHIFDFVYADAEKTLQAGNGQYTFIEYNDDVASQRGMIISPEMWRRFLKPRMKQFCDMAARYGAYVRYHSCGSVYEIIDDLIEVGVHILNPVQPMAANMDPREIKREFGDRICLNGAIDIQQLLPFGTPEEVKTEVKSLIRDLGENGGYILSAAHTIQTDVPTANIIALVEAIHETD